MLIYHNCNTKSKTFGDSKNKVKRVRNKYKSISSRKHEVILPKALSEEVQKKSKQKKEILKKNIQYLEGLGLKVKQDIKNG